MALHELKYIILIEKTPDGSKIIQKIESIIGYFFCDYLFRNFF